MFAKVSSKLFLCSLLIQSCASTSFKEKTLRNMLIASAVGVVVGQQEKDNRGSYSLIYAGALASGAAVGSILSYDPDREIEKCIGVSKVVADSLEQAISNPTGQSADALRSKTGGGLKNFGQIPEKYRNLITPGEWKISQISQWEQIDDYTLVHKTELLEIKPPAINISK